MGDTAHDSWDSNGLGGFIRREQARADVTYTVDTIQLYRLPVWAFHNLLRDHGAKFEKGKDNMSKHTPGPWKQAYDYIYYDDSLTGGLAHTICDISRHCPDWEANARLIAACPTMAQTLIDELDALRIWLGAETNADITEGMFISISKIKAALDEAGIADPH